MRAVVPLSLSLACTNAVDPEDTGPSLGSPQGIQLLGTVREVLSPGVLATEALCAELLDPGPLLAGGAPEVLDTSMVDNGTFVFDGVIARPDPGLLVAIDNCDGTNVVGLPTLSGIAPDQLDEVLDGAALQVAAYFVRGESLDALTRDAADVGYGGSLADGGFAIGYALDRGRPVGGVTVDCPTCSGVYYLDAHHEDGLFGEGPAANDSTDDVLGGFVVAEAGSGEYEATDTSGGRVFESVSAGGFPNHAVVFSFFPERDVTNPYQPKPPAPPP